MDPNQKKLDEILELVRDNNAMLHSVRRSNFMWGVIKVVAYLFLFAAPIWFYITYISGTIDQLVRTLNSVQGTAKVTQQKFSGFEDTVKAIQSFVQSSPEVATSSPDTPTSTSTSN